MLLASAGGSTVPVIARLAAGSCWAEQTRPERLPATYRRTQGITYFHGCYSVGDDQMWCINRLRKGIDHTWAAQKHPLGRQTPTHGGLTTQPGEPSRSQHKPRAGT